MHGYVYVLLCLRMCCLTFESESFLNILLLLFILVFNVQMWFLFYVQHFETCFVILGSKNFNSKQVKVAYH